MAERLLRTSFLGALSDEEADVQRKRRLAASLPGDPVRATLFRATRDRLLRIGFSR